MRLDVISKVFVREFCFLGRSGPMSTRRPTVPSSSDLPAAWRPGKKGHPPNPPFPDVADAMEKRGTGPRCRKGVSALAERLLTGCSFGSWSPVCGFSAETTCSRGCFQIEEAETAPRLGRRRAWNVALFLAWKSQANKARKVDLV